MQDEFFHLSSICTIEGDHSSVIGNGWLSFMGWFLLGVLSALFLEVGELVYLFLLSGLLLISPIEVESLVEPDCKDSDWIEPLLFCKVVGAFTKPSCPAKLHYAFSWSLDFDSWPTGWISLQMISLFSAPMEVGHYPIDVDGCFVV